MEIIDAAHSAPTGTGRSTTGVIVMLGAIALLNFVYDGFLALHRAKNLGIVQI